LPGRLKNGAHRVAVVDGGLGGKDGVRREKKQKEIQVWKEAGVPPRIQGVTVLGAEGRLDAVAVRFAIVVAEKCFGPEEGPGLYAPRQFQLRFVHIPKDAGRLESPTFLGLYLFDLHRGQDGLDYVRGQECPHRFRLGDLFDLRIGNAHLEATPQLTGFFIPAGHKKNRRAAMQPDGLSSPLSDKPTEQLLSFEHDPAKQCQQGQGDSALSCLRRLDLRRCNGRMSTTRIRQGTGLSSRRTASTAATSSYRPCGLSHRSAGPR